MISIYKNNLRRLSTVIFLLFSLSFLWSSPALAKKPLVGDPLFDSAVAGPLIFDGTEKLKLSKCCKPPKTPIEIQMSIPVFGQWQINAINGLEVVDIISDPDGVPNTGDEVLAANPIEGTYRYKNRVWSNLSFKDDTEKAQFIALIEDWASDEAGEPVFIDYKKMKLRLKVKGNKDGSYKLFLFLKLSLRRAESLGGTGFPPLGAGVYMLKAKVTSAIPVAPAPYEI